MKRTTCRSISILSVFVFFLITPVSIFCGTLDRSEVKRLKWIGPGNPGTYDEYKARFPFRPLNIKHVYHTQPNILNHRHHHRSKVDATSTQKIIIVVENSVYVNLLSHINTYVSNLESRGYTIQLHTYSGGTAEELKDILRSNSANLIGSVFIGQIPAAWYEVANDYDDSGYRDFPCDLFFMDLDGLWTDNDGNGEYDLHSQGTGDRQPEIFISRIDASMFPENEYDTLRNYFEKNAAYYAGSISTLPYGLTYTDDDWTGNTDIIDGMSELYEYYLAVTSPDTSREDYVQNRLSNDRYTFLQLACHSSSYIHSFTRGVSLTGRAIRQAPPAALAFNLFCCSAMRFTDPYYLGGSYIFNESPSALVCVGSTKTGSMLDFDHFYQSLGQNDPVGSALVYWFGKIGPYTPHVIYWHYGMTICGDPMITVKENARVIHPPVDAVANRIENKSMMQTEFIDVITWKDNPNNANNDVVKYELYLMVEGNGVLQTSIPVGEEYRYVVRGLKADSQRVYYLTSVTADGKSSPPLYLEPQ